MQYLYDRVFGEEKAAGTDRIYFPGEPERLLKAELDTLNKEATKLSLTPPSVRPYYGKGVMLLTYWWACHFNGANQWGS